MKDIVIIDAVRSAVGRAHKGSLAQKRPDEMAGEVIRGLLARNPKINAADLEDLVRRAGLAALKRSLSSDAVTMADFEAALKDTRASVTEAMERDYEKIQGEIKQAAMSVDPIGFFAPGMLKPMRERKHPEDTPEETKD